MFGNMFGQSTNTLQASNIAGSTQGTLTASISQPIGSNLPIFSLLPPGPRAISLEQSSAKKKPGFFVDIPTRSPVPRVQLGYSPANSKLRGFASSTNVGPSTSNPFSSSFNFTAPKQSAGLSINRAGSTPLLGGLPSGRAASPSLGTGGRQSVKKLILDKRVEPSDLFNRSARSASPAPSRPGITFSPALGVAAREKEAAAAAVPAVEPPPAKSSTTRTSNRFTAAEGDNAELKEGDYWSKPDLQTLISLSHAELRSCKNLVIGRVGYGEIHFLEPVDLTGLTRIRQLYGDVVKIEDKECSVYPEIDDSEKPVPGTHLNVRARIILLRCWPNDKATREPIKEESHPLMVRHMKKLKGMRDTHFESYQCAEGKWTFTVDHF
jgi:nuclear pore complex protein Nup98-Nup96